jgi:hypothetical protein
LGAWVLVELRYGVKNCQACAHGPFGVVVMCFGIAEECHHAIAEILRDMPAETLDGLRRRTMVLANDLPPFFRVEMAGYLGRADQITEKHRQMAPLTFGRVLVDNDVV